MDTYDNEIELYHHGTKGMKWGVRRYQNKDGSLTPAGKKRYSSINKEKIKETSKKVAKKTAKVAAKTVVTGAKAYSQLKTAEVLDEVFYGGAGKKAVIMTGRAAVTAYTMARGGYDIRWYDK